MAKIPSSIRIKRNIKYDIVYQDLIGGDPNCLGMCDPNTKHIYIKNGLSKREELKTYIHECAHSLFDENNIKISHRDVYKIEEALYRLLTLNKFI